MLQNKIFKAGTTAIIGATALIASEGNKKKDYGNALPVRNETPLVVNSPGVVLSEQDNTSLDAMLAQLRTPRSAILELPSTDATEKAYSQYKLASAVSQYQLAKAERMKSVVQTINRGDLPEGCVEFLYAQAEAVSLLGKIKDKCQEKGNEDLLEQAITDTSNIRFGSPEANELISMSQGNSFAIEFVGPGAPKDTKEFSTPEIVMRQKLNELINQGFESARPAAEWIGETVMTHEAEKFVTKVIGKAAGAALGFGFTIKDFLESTNTGCSGLNESWDKELEQCVINAINERYPKSSSGESHAAKGYEFDSALSSHLQSGMTHETNVGGDNTNNKNNSGEIDLPGTPVEDKPKRGGNNNNNNGGEKPAPGITLGQR